MKKIKLGIKGMHCGSCAGNIESALSKVPGVSKASVSAMTNKAIIEAEESVNEKDLRAAIEKVGYKVV